MGTSVWPSSPPGVVRPNSMCKRGVSFHHLRRSSTTSAVATGSAQESDELLAPESQPHARSSQKHAISETPLGPSSPPTRTPDLRSKKEGKRLSKTPRIRVRKPVDLSQDADTEARKVSTELGKACEEAFFRSSVGSSTQVSETEKIMTYETPPSSFLTQQIKPSPMLVDDQLRLHNADSGQNRPLPSLPETPNSFLKRELVETRKRLAAYRAAEGDEDTTANLSEVMAHIDGLLQASSLNDNQMAGSRHDYTTIDTTDYLPIIEEDDEARERWHRRFQDRRAATDPVQTARPLPSPRRYTEQQTIRVIEPSSPTAITPQPLNIRKRSRETLAPTPNNRGVGTAYRGEPAEPLQPRSQESHDWLSRRSGTVITDPPNLSSHNNNPETFYSPAKKMGSWFRRRGLASEPTGSARPPVPIWQDVDDQSTRNLRPVTRQGTEHGPTSATTSEFPMREKREEKTGLREGFLKMFSKKSDKKTRGSRFDISCKCICLSIIFFRFITNGKLP